MKIVKLSLDEIFPDPDNQREHSERNLQIIEDSLRTLGQYRDFVIQKSNRMIRVGNGMYEAMRRMNWQGKVSCVILDLTDDMGRALSILDNRASELSCFDDVQLAEQLRALDDSIRRLCGFSPEEIDRMLDTIPEPTFRDETDTAALTPAGTSIVFGDIRIKITRRQYDAWLESIRLSAGMSDAEIVAEIRRRLGV